MREQARSPLSARIQPVETHPVEQAVVDTGSRRFGRPLVGLSEQSRLKSAVVEGSAEQYY
jgi:hypothetical protein